MSALVLLTTATLFSLADSPYDLPPALQRVVALAHDPASAHVMIEAHRGALSPELPENSIASIEYAVALGVDWVEIDVALTRDGALVLMHDNTLDRTTTLSGAVGDYTLSEIQAAFLRLDSGALTEQHPPSLAEALDAMAGRIHFRLDLKCGEACLEAAYDLVSEKGLMDQAVIPLSVRPRALAEGLTDDQIIVMGAKIEEVGTPDAAPAGADYLQLKDFSADNPPLALAAEFTPHVRLVAFPYDDRRAGGRGDGLSASDPEAGWGWLVAAGADIFLTDTPEAAISWLEANGLRDAR